MKANADNRRRRVLEAGLEINSAITAAKKKWKLSVADTMDVIHEQYCLYHRILIKRGRAR